MTEERNRVKTPHELEPVRKLNQTVVDKTGFEASDLLSAPTKPPELKNTRSQLSTMQYTVLATGLGLIVVGFLVAALLASIYVGIAFTAIGALCIALAVMIRI